MSRRSSGWVQGPLAGLLPIPEVQYQAYLHNAEDQIRGEVATLPFFSRGRFSNPMVVRIASLGYQKGFDGHFHNDNQWWCCGIFLDWSWPAQARGRCSCDASDQRGRRHH